MGIEPTYKGFADLSLTTWVPRRLPPGTKDAAKAGKTQKPSGSFVSLVVKKLERETGFEPATSTLARSHSTTELLPLGHQEYK